MSSPTPDDYAGLVTPWKPIAEFAMKNVTSIHNRIEIDHGAKDRDIAETDSVGAIIRSHVDAQREDVEASETDSVNTDMIVGDGSRDPEMEDSGVVDIDNINVDSSIGDGALIDGGGATDTDNDASQRIDTKCVAVSTCVANSGDHRKVVSHIFGRNKACTRELPNTLWIFWCRKHYQRFKYRAEDAENWHTIQLGLVRNQLQMFEDWGSVHTWTISLRKAEQDALAKENKIDVTYTNYISSCWERFLVPYLGPNKTFAQIREVLNVIERKFNEAEYRNRDKKLKTFPGVEFLPTVQKAKEVKKPAAKKGEIGYKKITLDQPAFSRKTRANMQVIKDMAAKNGEGSNTPKSSRAASKKAISPDTDTLKSSRSVSKKVTSANTDNDSDASATKKHETPATDDANDDTAHDKRESVDATTTVNPHSKTFPTKRKSTASTTSTTTPPLVFESVTLPTKRRRLTRGYEKHGSEGEDTSFMEKEDEDEE